jgi:hypothetical protein
MALNSGLFMGRRPVREVPDDLPLNLAVVELLFQLIERNFYRSLPSSGGFGIDDK